MTNQKWEVRPAKISDIDQIIEAVRLLIAELRDASDTELPSTSGNIVEKMITGNIPGAIFIAETVDDEKSCIGILTISVQEAIHIGGKYALIQELWVHPDYRNSAIGSQLMNVACKFCQAYNLSTLEVCLPRKEFRNFNNTYHFYQKVGFSEIGPRMRK